MENQLKFKTSKDVIRYLAATFSRCFSVTGDAKPLKIGVFHDLVQRLDSNSGLSRLKLRAALRLYTSSWRYLYAMKTGVNRIDLDGNPCGHLTAEHVIYADKKLKERRTQQRKIIPANGERNRVHRRVPKACPHSKRGTIRVARSQPVLTKVKNFKIGDQVNANVGHISVQGELIALEKENARIKIQSGMEITIKSCFIFK